MIKTLKLSDPKLRWGALEAMDALTQVFIFRIYKKTFLSIFSRPDTLPAQLHQAQKLKHQKTIKLFLMKDPEQFLHSNPTYLPGSPPQLKLVKVPI